MRATDPSGEPEDEYFVVMAVSDLPEVEPFRAQCMGVNYDPKAASPWLPFKKPCCDYHARDWKAITETAIQVLADAHRQGLFYAREIDDYVLTRLEELPLGKMDRNEVMCLFAPSEAIMFGHTSTLLTNGQHRTQAMRDQGVERTVALRWPAPGGAAEGVRSD